MTAVAISTRGDAYIWRALQIAMGQVGVRETSPNRGPEVDQYLRAAGLDPTRGSYRWCMAYVYWCLRRAATEMGIACPAPRTASCSNAWKRSPGAACVTNAQEVTPGMVFLLDMGRGRGHTGFVGGVDFEARILQTVEGNTNASGGRDGDGVYTRTRPLGQPYGFLDFSRVVT